MYMYNAHLKEMFKYLPLTGFQFANRCSIIGQGINLPRKCTCTCT